MPSVASPLRLIDTQPHPAIVSEIELSGVAEQVLRSSLTAFLQPRVVFAKYIADKTLMPPEARMRSPRSWGAAHTEFFLNTPNWVAILSQVDEAGDAHEL